MAASQPQSSLNEQSGPPEIRPEEIILEELIGSGSFGKVYKGRCRQKAVAVKILHKQQFDPQTLAVFRKEVYLMSKIYHPNVCLFMGAVTIPGKLMIVTEIVSKGNMETLLHDEKIVLPLPLRMRMARDAALGVLWLHESSPTFIHRDLKTSNLLVDENMRVKICDFGLSTVKPQRHQMLKDQTTAKGTPLFMAPEVMMFREFNESSDVYSFGIVLWEILTRQEPFSQFRALDEFRQAVCVRHERPIIPPDTLESLKRLIERCWDKDPTRRPSFREIVVALEHVSVEAAINDTRGREFWKRYFLTEPSIGWEAFADAFCDWFKLPAPATYDKGSEEHLNLRCLKAMFAPEVSAHAGGGAKGVGPQNIVTQENFGRMLEFFGPFQEGILQTVRNMLQERWFYGDFETTHAASRLQNQPFGSFLIRFSGTQPGCFSISSVNSDGTIRHQRAQHISGKGFNYNGVIYPTLNDLVSQVFDVTKACPSTQFAPLFENYKGTGYHMAQTYG